MTDLRVIETRDSLDRQEMLETLREVVAKIEEDEEAFAFVLSYAVGTDVEVVSFGTGHERISLGALAHRRTMLDFSPEN